MPIYEIAGSRYNFDEGISLPGAIDILVSDGTITPEQGLSEVGQEVPRPDTGNLSPFLPQESGSASAAQAIGLGRTMSQLGFGADLGATGPVFEDQPVAVGFGASLPMFTAGPSIAGAGFIGGSLEIIKQRERFKDDPVGAAISSGLEGTRQAAYTAGGRVVSELAGRTVNAIIAAGRNTVSSVRSGIDSLDLPSGIRTTLGKLTGNRQIQQAEASLARNPITSRRFVAADAQNERVMRDKVLTWLGKAPGGKLETAMAETVTEAVAKMDEGIPTGVKVTIPPKLQGLFARLNKVTTEAFDLPVADVVRGVGGPRGVGGARGQFTIKGKPAPVKPLVVSGADTRAIVSDLRAGTRSGVASVRRRSRQALNELDRVLQGTEGINTEVWREGSRQYGRWERLSRPGVISRADPEKINPTSLFRVVEKGNKVAARSRGNVSSGDPVTDDMLNAAKDLEQVGSLTPDSGTPTGMAVPVVAADIVATGGVGTGAAFVASELVESPVGLGIAEGLATAAPGASRAGGVTIRQVLNTMYPEDEDDSEQ